MTNAKTSSLTGLKQRRIIGKVAFYVLGLLMAIIVCIPFYWMIITSLKGRGAIMSIPVEWIPKEPTLDAYKKLFAMPEFVGSIFNSFYVSVLCTAVRLLCAAMAAFALTKIPFKGRNAVFGIYVTALMIPSQITFIPLFIIMTNMHLTENLVAVISWRRARLDIALITADNKIAFRDQIPLTEEEDKVDKITSTFFNIMKPKVGDRRIMGLCIIIPGIIDAENKRILSTVIGVGYSDPVVQRFEEAFHDYPFCLLNDTACFAYAEYVFANITEPNFAYINVSKGVGACLFANGKMLRGAGSNATQFGHFSVDRNGPLCACGNHGCVERVVGENALTERAEACGIDLTRFAGRKPLYCDIGAMAEDGDVHAKELIKDLAVDLSFAISNLITLFNPSLVVIGGMGVNLGPFFLSNIRDEVQNSGFKEFVSNTWIQYSTLGLDSELGGAARYYIDHYYDFFEQMQGGLYAD